MTTSPGVSRQHATQDVSKSREALLLQYREARQQTEELCQPLAVEDYCIQCIPEVSPPKWHLAHTTWFFETFLLIPFVPRYKPFHPGFDYLFNSYYETVGVPYPRSKRGLLSRPTVDEVYRYRAHVDTAMVELIATAEDRRNDIALRVTLGIHHEQQHQELLLTDIKYNFSVNPLRPVYRALPLVPRREAAPVEWTGHEGGVVMIGHDGPGFAFDNETPRHRVYVADFFLAARPVTNGGYLEFMEAGGYRRSEYWLSDGWRTVREKNWQAPLYWERIDGQWWQFTLAGMRPVDEDAPVCHVCFYEAEAYARWAGKRLPSEAEWERVAAAQTPAGNLRETGYLHPAAAEGSGSIMQLYGDVWEWTRSPYAPYPGFRPLAGSLGEYNGKFMCNQVVLRGGSCVTPISHIRATYRNFFYPADRWQFSGFRLADDR